MYRLHRRLHEVKLFFLGIPQKLEDYCGILKEWILHPYSKFDAWRWGESVNVKTV